MAQAYFGVPRVGAFLSMTVVENFLFNSLSNITKSAKVTGRIQICDAKVLGLYNKRLLE